MQPPQSAPFAPFGAFFGYGCAGMAYIHRPLGRLAAGSVVVKRGWRSSFDRRWLAVLAGTHGAA